MKQGMLLNSGMDRILLLPYTCVLCTGTKFQRGMYLLKL